MTPNLKLTSLISDLFFLFLWFKCYEKKSYVNFGKKIRTIYKDPLAEWAYHRGIVCRLIIMAWIVIGILFLLDKLGFVFVLIFVLFFCFYVFEETKKN